MKKKKLRYVYTRYRVLWYTDEARCTRIFDDKQEAERFSEEVRGDITYVLWDMYPYYFYRFLT